MARDGVSSCEPNHARLLQLPRGPHPGSNPHESRFHELSHGESFLEILRTRFDSPGLYCLDEPEAALSFSAQLALVGTLHDPGSRWRADPVCHTSALLAAMPGANVLEVGDWG